MKLPEDQLPKGPLLFLGFLIIVWLTVITIIFLHGGT